MSMGECEPCIRAFVNNTSEQQSESRVTVMAPGTVRRSALRMTSRGDVGCALNGRL